MNTTTQQRFRSMIEANLRDLEIAAKTTQAEIKQTSEANANVFQDELDCAKAEVDLKTAFELHNHNISQQILLRNALARMETGAFGVCLSCDDEIDLRRLEAMPEATLCINCQSHREGIPVRSRPRTVGFVPRMLGSDYGQTKAVA